VQHRRPPHRAVTSSWAAVMPPGEQQGPADGLDHITAGQMCVSVCVSPSPRCPSRARSLRLDRRELPRSASQVDVRGMRKNLGDKAGSWPASLVPCVPTQGQIMGLTAEGAGLSPSPALSPLLPRRRHGHLPSAGTHGVVRCWMRIPQAAGSCSADAK